jgi:hypothetical protein
MHLFSHTFAQTEYTPVLKKGLSLMKLYAKILILFLRSFVRQETCLPLAKQAILRCNCMQILHMYEQRICECLAYTDVTL